MRPGSASSLMLAPVGSFPPRLRQCVAKTWQILSSLSVCTFPFPAGLWLYLAGSSLPCLTLIGSPNFGYRSVHRDLEAQIAIVTESRALQQQLHEVCWSGGVLGHMGCSHAIGVLTGGFCLSHFRQGARFSRQTDRQSVVGEKLGSSSLRGTLESQACPGLWHCQDRLVPHPWAPLSVLE